MFEAIAALVLCLICSFGYDLFAAPSTEDEHS